MRFHPSRSGQGTVIIIAALFICVMAVMQVAQSYLLTQIGDQTARASLGRMCGLVAESAIDEARLIMAVRVDTREDPLFDEIRTKGPTTAPGSKIASVDLKLADLPRLGRLLATETGKTCELVEPLTVEFQSAGPLTIVNGAEIAGVVVYKVRTRSKLDKSIVREVEETQGFKMGQIALPAPLGTKPLWIRDPFKIAFGRRNIDPAQPAGADVNNLRRVIVEQHLPSMKAKYAEVMRFFADKLREAGGDSRADPLKRLSDLYETITNNPGQGGKNHIDVVDKLGAVIRKYDAATADQQVPYLFVAVPDAVKLESVNLQLLLFNRVPQLARVVGEIDALGPQVEARFRANDQSEAAFQLNDQYVKKMIEELTLLEDVLTQIGTVQSTFAEVKISSDAATYAGLQRLFASVDPHAMAYPNNALAARAFWRIRQDGSGTIQQQWEALKKRLDTFGAGFCGTVYIDNPDQILTLSGELAGNLVIAVTGKLIVDGLKAKFAPDTLTVVARGGEPGAVKLTGQITASISTRGAALLMEPNTSIVGTLILDELPLLLTAGLTGSVQVDPRLADTSKPPFFYVALSPWMRSRNTVRF